MSILDLDAELSQSLAATEAAPDYVTPENGVYILTVADTSADKKPAKDKEKAIKEGKPLEYIALGLRYTIDQVIEQEGAPIKPGSLFSEQFVLGDPGTSYFKARVRDIAVATGGNADDVDALSIKEALEAVKGLSFKVNIKQMKRTTPQGEMINVRLSNIRAVDA